MFFQDAAVAYTNHEATQKGAQIELNNFELQQYREQDLKFAPPGRRHRLVYNKCKLDDLKVVAHSAMSRGPISVASLYKIPPDRVEIVSVRALVVDVGNEESRYSPKTQSNFFMRAVTLGTLDSSAPRVKWTLFGKEAIDVNASRVLYKDVCAVGAELKFFQGRPQLSKGKLMLWA